MLHQTLLLCKPHSRRNLCDVESPELVCASPLAGALVRVHVCVYTDLPKAHGWLLLGLECGRHLLGPVEEGHGVVGASASKAPPSGLTRWVQDYQSDVEGNRKTGSVILDARDRLEQVHLLFRAEGEDNEQLGPSTVSQLQISIICVRCVSIFSLYSDWLKSFSPQHVYLCAKLCLIKYGVLNTLASVL